MTDFSLPPELEDFRLPDALFGDAYEATPPERRGWIKTTLALVETTYAPLPSCSEQRTECAAAGYGQRIRQTIAPWAALVIGPEYVSPIRLSAAIMSARLAGVEPLLALLTGTPEHMPLELLTALELTGIEHSFAVPDATPVLTKLAAEGRGRILGFGISLSALARQLDIPLWTDVTSPCLGVPDASAYDLETIRWAHPDARFMPAPERQCEPERRYAALYTPESFPHLYAPLRLCPGLEGAWVCSDLSPSFFSTSEMTLYGL